MNVRLFSLLILFFTALLSGYAQEKFEKLGGDLNSSANEAAPVLSPDSQTLYFVRQYHPQNVGGISDPGDIWYSERREDGQWGEAKHAGKTINNRFYNAIIGFSDEQSAYVHGHYLKQGKKPTTQGVSMTQGQHDQWNFPKAVEIPYFYTKSGHRSGSLHASNNIMIVTLQSYDTRGAEDLYVLFRQSNGSWSEPKNLGNDINTAYQEMTPFLAPDGKTLFFASNGYEGFGSRDIFMSVRLDDSWRSWSNPKNLGATVNTIGTELYYSIPQNSEYAYLTSTQNSDGMADLARIRISPEEEETLEEADSLDIPEEVPVAAVQPSGEVTPEPEVTEEIVEEDPVVPMMTISGTVAGENNQQPLTAEVIVQSIRNDTTLVETVQTDADGTFSVSLPQDDSYELLIQSEGFIRKRDKVLLAETGSADAIERNYLLTPIEVGSTVNLETVLFDRGTASMLPGSDERLDEVVTFLQENPEVAIEVGGHTDNQGRADLNLELSQKRAEAVRDYLIQQGADAERVTAKGYGGTQPIASNAIEEERRKNRRVAFTIVRK
jgi:outer membrane protein OmpA-like peptidoglycan-associated protein